MTVIDKWIDQRLANLADHAMDRLETTIETRLAALPAEIRDLLQTELREVLSAIDGRFDQVLDHVPDVDDLADRLRDRLDLDGLAAKLGERLKGWWPL